MLQRSNSVAWFVVLVIVFAALVTGGVARLGYLSGPSVAAPSVPPPETTSLPPVTSTPPAAGGQTVAEDSDVSIHMIGALDLALEEYDGSYVATEVLIARLQPINRVDVYQTGPSHAEDQFSVSVSSDGRVVVFAVRSDSGHCFFAEENKNSLPSASGMGTSVSPGLGESYAELLGDNASCSASSFVPGSGPPVPLVWQLTPIHPH